MAQPAYPSIRKNAAVSTAIDTDCFVRFKDAYDKEVQDWVDNAEAGVITGPNAWDGYLAAITADALSKSSRKPDRIRENRFSMLGSRNFINKYILRAPPHQV